jgi:hypothetical protein
MSKNGGIFLYFSYFLIIKTLHMENYDYDLPHFNESVLGIIITIVLVVVSIVINHYICKNKHL